MGHSKTAEFLRSLKLKFYKQALLLALLVILFLWAQILLSRTTNTPEIYIFPVFAIFCAASLWLFLKYRADYLSIFETLGFTLAFLYFTLHFTFTVVAAFSQPELSFRKFLIWIPVIYGLAFVIYPPRRALQFSAFFLASIFIPGAVYGLTKWRAVDFDNNLTLLLQIYASGLIYISLFYIIAALKEKISEIDRGAILATKRADTDALTKAFSRAKIMEVLDACIASNALHSLTFSIAFIDVNQLKRINDTCGHGTGDYVLQRLVQLVGENLRENDMLGRIGGDEFLLILPDTNNEQARAIAERFGRLISEAAFQEVGMVTISIGVATIQEGDSKKSLLARADKEMYAQKEQYRLLRDA